MRRLASIHSAEIFPKQDSHSKLLNLTGFFSSFGGAAGKPATVAASVISGSSCRLGGPDRGRRARRSLKRILRGVRVTREGCQESRMRGRKRRRAKPREGNDVHKRVRAVLGAWRDATRQGMCFGRGALELFAAHVAFLTCESTICADPYGTISLHSTYMNALLQLRRVQQSAVLLLAVTRSSQQCAAYRMMGE